MAEDDDRPIVDWLRGNAVFGLTPFQEAFRRHNWATTDLGPIVSWPDQLCQLVLQVFADTRPTIVLWGHKETAMIYNEAYEPLVRPLHPQLLGNNPANYFSPAVWDSFEQVIIKGRRSGKMEKGSVNMVPLVRDGHQQEGWYEWQYLPVVGTDGRVAGFLANVTDRTDEIILDRRMATILKLNKRISEAKNLTNLWTLIMRGLEHNPEDLPMALLYSVSDENAEEGSPPPSGFTCVLEGAIGVPRGHVAAPRKFSLDAGTEGFAPYFRKAMSKEGAMLLKIDEVPAKLVTGLDWKGYREPSREIVICPIPSSSSNKLLAFLVIGLNPRTPHDQSYSDFIGLLMKQISIPKSSSILFEEEIRRRTKSAARATAERDRLSRELSAQHALQQQTVTKFARLATRAAVGLAICDAEGNTLFANDKWYELLSLDRSTTSVSPWEEAAHVSDSAMVRDAWSRLLTLKTPLTIQWRLKKPWISPPDETGSSSAAEWWVTSSAFVDLDDDGNVREITATLVDTAAQKFHEHQLLVKTQEISRTGAQWHQFVDMSPFGITFLNAEGKQTYQNKAWSDITGQSKDLGDGYAWRDVYHADDTTAAMKAAESIISGAVGQASFEGRTKRLWTPPGVDSLDEEFYAWIQVHALTVDKGPSEDVAMIVTCADTSLARYAEHLQRRQMEDALEVKRQQENFIDMTSHEMRNPLSAMQFCAEEILNSLSAQIDALLEPSTLRTSLESCIEAAQTITYCTSHMKRIIDDVLVLSRLDLDVLLIHPVATRPTDIVRDGIRVFEGELKSTSTSLSLEIEPSVRELHVDWVMIDPSRVLQILINLVTNSIKFTGSEAVRNITVSLGASDQRPGPPTSDFEYFPSRQHKAKDVTQNAEWGSGDSVYLRVTVTDTGRGMTAEEKKLLFMRFSQTSPRTHVQYGGSGLGLFISRQLTELQGGEIGVASRSGEGSTFAFYVKARRSQPPESDAELLALPPNLRQAITRQISLAGGSTSSHVPSKRRKFTLAEQRKLLPENIRVLIVEDNLVNQKVLKRQLVGRGFTVDVANHGEEALDYLRQTNLWKNNKEGTSLSVVLLDWEMPIMDGVQFAQRVRTLERERTLVGRVPIIGVTANVRAEQVAIAKAAGMDDVTTKPFQMGEIIQKIERLIMGADEQQ